jgi:hypothetical protein
MVPLYAHLRKTFSGYSDPVVLRLFLDCHEFELLVCAGSLLCFASPSASLFIGTKKMMLQLP